MKTLITLILLVVTVSPSFAAKYSVSELRVLVVDVLDTLETNNINFDKESYTKLLMETAAVETDLGGYNRNKKSPDKGVFQINIHTYNDIMENYLHPHTKASHRIVFQSMLESNRDYTKSLEWNLKHNDYFNATLSFVVYFRAIRGRRLRSFDNVWTRAWLWKKYYNTHLGLGTTDRYVQKRDYYFKEGY